LAAAANDCICCSPDEVHLMMDLQQPNLFASLSLSVSDLTRYLRQLLESDAVLQDVWVSGEISNLSRPSSGHIYFTLKDPNAALRCVIWRSTAARIRLELQNGRAVEAHGSIGIYERDGNYQLYVTALRPAGEGVLYQEFLRLKAKLESEGLFEEGRKRPIPERPQRIGVVTSPTGAALQDILNTLRGRYPLAEVILAPAAVQGDEAPVEIVIALRALVKVSPDVILVARGGGSLEDLWAFNDERVVRTIAASPVPVITGIGHETDFTLADFAADLRAPTPTGAAVMATPERADLDQELLAARARLESLVQGLLFDSHSHFEELHARLGRLSPLWRIQNDRQRLDEVSQRAVRALQHGLALRRSASLGLSQRLASLNPLAVLQRGYALVSDPQGRLVRTTSQVHPGLVVEVRLADGSFGAEVKAK
jgi:exodeoxyribonuclease VII large subunit